MVAMHVLQRIFGTMIMAAPDPLTARAMVDRAEAAMGVDDFCHFCSVMLSVPAAIACAKAGDVEHARHHLELAERSASLWEGTAWEGWVAEAKAHIAIATAEPDEARQLLSLAITRFDAAGQPLDATRCRELSGAP
jgi:hypothetical protein